MKKLLLKCVGYMAIVSLSLVVVACSHSGTRLSYVNSYQLATAEQKALAIDLSEAGFDADWALQKIKYTLGDLKVDDLADRIKQNYAPELYFNDTLHTHKTASGLAEYMKKTADRLYAADVQFDDLVMQKKDVYARWSMSYQRTKTSEVIHSIGMTHFRFNAQGQIILHQDYWDGVEGFYRSVPVLGFVLERIKASL